MNAISEWLAPDVLRNLGLALSHFVWQGAAIAALAAAAMAVARKASARYAIGVAALALMFAAPLVTFFVLSNPAAAPAAPPAASLAVAGTTANLTAAHTRVAGRSEPALPVNVTAMDWLVTVWFAGVLLFSLRTAGGFFVVARLRRRDSHPVSAELLARCRDLQQRLGITRAVRYCESLHLDAPAVLGWFRPVVFLPLSALTGLTEAQLRAVIAHELAHIRRFDAFVNVFQVAVETLLFYHPGVWWLNKRIRAERENCCDDVASSVCGNPAEYARALALMEEWRVAPSLAMAVNRGPLASRVARLLGLSEKGSGLRNAGVAFGILCVATAMMAANALFGIVRPVSARSLFSSQKPAVEISSSEPVITVTAPRAAPEARPAQKAAAAQAAQPGQAAAPKPSYIDGLKAEGFDNLSADDLIAMKVQGITPEYIHEIRAEGLKPSADELVAMKVQGITPDYIRQIRAMKLASDIDSLISMKVQGITAEYVDQIHKLGFTSDSDQLVAMKVQGITPEYVDQMRKLGFQPDGDQIIAMKVQGITPEYVDQMRKLGFQADADQVVAMKVQGIGPEYVKALNELGIRPDADDLIGMKVQGINADYVSSIRSTGIKPDKDEWIALKVQGVTADYIKGLQAAGFKPDVDEIVGAKVQGITPQFIELAKSHGFKNLDLDKLIQLKHAGVLE
jgi:beta-lactamase regulating signal transducer with metallopeptidase domain/predicted flap endonuclease-1-like 5' DNA nuclease